MISLAVLSFPNIDPVMFSVGPFAVRWYAMAYILGLIFGMWYMKRLVMNPDLWAGTTPSATPQQIDDLFLWAMLGVVLGGRLGYVLFYGTAQTLADPSSVLRTWEGGMSFHGGFFGVILASYFFGKRHNIGLDRLLDLGAAATPVGLGLGRLANFVNGELYGRVTGVPWAFVFPNGGAAPRHPSQLYEFALEGILLFVLINVAVYRSKILTRPGRAAGIYALTYACSRIVVEFVREPDAQLGFFGGFITMGMILSLPLIVIGVWLLWRSRTLK
jgi:phosphatidylglycerol---prolipoprotein diacylglyceryl transferase